MAGLEAGGGGQQSADGDLVEYLVLFAHHNMYFNMRFQELEAIAGLLGVAEKERLYVESPPPTALSASPFALVRLPSEQAAKQLCERSVLVKAVLEVWAQGRDFKEAVEQALAAGPSARARRRLHMAPPKTFQIRATAFGRTMEMEDKREAMELLRPLFDCDEVVNLQDPDTTVWALAEHTHLTGEKTHLGPRASAPLQTFVCRQVAGGRSIDKKMKHGEKAYFQRYDLSERAVLGPTTLDNELAFIMANCAGVQRGDVVLEPFCGTGGIAVALSHFGARVVGGEIDIRVVKGWRVAYTKNKSAAQEVARARGRTGGEETTKRGEAQRDDAAASSSTARPVAASRDGRLSLEYLARIQLISAAGGGAAGREPEPDEPGGYNKTGHADLGRDIFTNFVQYDMQLPEIVVCDNASRPWRRVEGGWCHSIVTDPPYGVRAAAKKQGRGSGVAEIRDRATYVPPTVNYGEDELASDLLDLAAEALHDGGHLVFLAPVDLADFLGIDRAAAERDGGPRGTLHEASMPKGGRKKAQWCSDSGTRKQKDARLCISETTRDPLLLDAARYRDFLPGHLEMEPVNASLQVLSGGLGRLLVTMRRRPRCRVGAT